MKPEPWGRMAFNRGGVIKDTEFFYPRAACMDDKVKPKLCALTNCQDTSRL